jgi:hypothetical protein
MPRIWEYRFGEARSRVVFSRRNPARACGPELNPNVAMEWGWMRGMGRDVLYLVEQDFKRQRADWGGLIECAFDWANPGPDIKAGVKAWLKKSL